jgi:phosphoribosylformimino-5-aminoimidazole carboxamide ribotide isomerase
VGLSARVHPRKGPHVLRGWPAAVDGMLLDMHLLPAIDLRGGKVVRLLKGDYDRQTTYGDDPLAQARGFEAAGATWLHVVDLDGARSGRPEHAEVIERICQETSLTVEVGGGIRDEAAIEQLLDAGARRVILGTAALRQWDWFRRAVHDRFPQRLVLGLDARDGRLAVAGWEEELSKTALDVAREVSDWPLAAIVFTDIATDGTLAGPNLAATRSMAEATHVPIVASGGVGTVDHLHALRQLPVEGVIVGRALYDGTVTIDEALQAVEG